MIFARGPTVQNKTKLRHLSLPAGVSLSLPERKRKTTTEKSGFIILQSLLRLENYIMQVKEKKKKKRKKIK